MIQLVRKIAKKKISKPAGIESRIVPVADIPVKYKILVYGRSGTGKTAFIGTAPKPLLILDCKDEGTISVRTRPDTFALPLTCWNDFEEIYWYILNNPDKYKTIAVDTLTQLQGMALKQVVGDNGGSVTKRAWGLAAGMMTTWFMNYRDLPLNMVFTAQDRENSVEDFEETGDIFPEMGPYLMPSVAKIVTAAVGFVGQTFIREVEQVTKVKGKKGTREVVKVVPEFGMRVGPHSRYLTKFRQDHLAEDAREIPPFIANPTFDDIIKYSMVEG